MSLSLNNFAYIFTHPRSSQSRKGQFLRYRTPSEARLRAVRPKAAPREADPHGDVCLTLTCLQLAYLLRIVWTGRWETFKLKTWNPHLGNCQNDLDIIESEAHCLSNTFCLLLNTFIYNYCRVEGVSVTAGRGGIETIQGNVPLIITLRQCVYEK